MEIPFDVERRAKEKLDYDIRRFFELYIKYRDDVDEVLEFAELYKRFVYIEKNKYEV